VTEATEIIEYQEIAPVQQYGGAVQLLPVKEMLEQLKEYDARRSSFIEWVLSHMKEGLHYGFPPGCQAKYDAQGNLLIGGKSYPITQWKPKAMIYKTGLMLLLDLLRLQPKHEPDTQTWEMLGSQQGTIFRKCTLFRGDIMVGEGFGACGVKEKSTTTINSAIKQANTRALREAVMNAFPMIAELFGEPYDGDESRSKSDGSGDTSESKQTPVTRKQKQELIAIVDKKMSEKKCDGMNPVDFLAVIIGDILGKPSLDTMSEYEEVKAAIDSGDYDLNTGERIPENK